MVAAGHPLTAEAGAGVLREGGNAVDAAVAAMLTSWVAEPLLTGPGAGGYLLVAGAGEEPTLLDFFVESPGRGVADPASRAELVPVVVSFGDADQVFNVGPASCGAYGTPAGIAEAARRWGTMPLADLAAPAAELARKGVPINRQQAYVFEILAGILFVTPESEALFVRDGRALRGGGRVPQRGARRHDRAAGPRRRGALLHGGHRGCDRRLAPGARGMLTHEDLRAYEAVPREPARATYRGRDVHHQPAAVGRRHPARPCDGPPGRGTRPAERHRHRRPRWRWRRTSARRTSSRAWPSRASCARFLGSRLGGDHPHLGARRRGPRMLGDLHQR